MVNYAVGCMLGRYSLDKPGLVYAHSGNTLSRMRTEYVVPLLGKISARIGHLDRDITGATGKHRRDLEKEQATLRRV